MNDNNQRVVNNHIILIFLLRHIPVSFQNNRTLPFSLYPVPFSLYNQSKKIEKSIFAFVYFSIISLSEIETRPRSLNPNFVSFSDPGGSGIYR